MSRFMLVCLALSLVGCPRMLPMEDAGAEDAGRPPSADAGDGNDFEGTIVLDDDLVRAMDPSTLREGNTPCREPVLVRIYNVTDGDTIDARGEDVVLDAPVRMIGVDTPEVSRGGDPADCYGDEAAAFTEQLQGRLVWLTFDAECFDRFNRLLAYVHIGPGDGDMWERQVLRRGFGTELHIAPNNTYQSLFTSDEATAASQSVGLWDACF
jgi:micrococcal nuclease